MKGRGPWAVNTNGHLQCGKLPSEGLALPEEWHKQGCMRWMNNSWYSQSYTLKNIKNSWKRKRWRRLSVLANDTEERAKCCNMLVKNKQIKVSPQPVRAPASCLQWITQMELSLQCMCKPVAVTELHRCSRENGVWQNWSLVLILHCHLCKYWPLLKAILLLSVWSRPLGASFECQKSLQLFFKFCFTV